MSSRGDDYEFNATSIKQKEEKKKLRNLIKI